MNNFIFLLVHTLCMVAVAISSVIEFFVNILPFVFFGELIIDLSNPLMTACEKAREWAKL